MTTTDFTVSEHGTIILLTPQNEAAFAWADEHIDANRQQLGQEWIPIDHRCAQPILEHIIADGYTVSLQ